MFPSGRDNEERGDEVDKEEVGEIESWSEEELGEEWEQWEFVEQDDVEEDQEYEEEDERRKTKRMIMRRRGRKKKARRRRRERRRCQCFH